VVTQGYAREGVESLFGM
jgi:hypothetical protein